MDRARADRRLFERFADPDDPVDRDAVVERFLPLARNLAGRYQRPDEPFDDIHQVACLALVKAVERFDPARGPSFTSFAVPTIVGEIKRHFRDHTWAVRVPRDLKDLTLRVEGVVADLTRDLGRAPSVDEIATALGRDPEDVLDALQAGRAYRATSLDAPRASAGDEPDETVADTLGGPDDGYTQAEHRAVLQRLTRLLSGRERLVLRLRFEEDLTQAEIGERIGVSQMQVSRILRQSLQRLHELAQSQPASRPLRTPLTRRAS